jgi:hypothetical protein
VPFCSTETGGNVEDDSVDGMVIGEMKNELGSGVMPSAHMVAPPVEQHFSSSVVAIVPETGPSYRQVMEELAMQCAWYMRTAGGRTMGLQPIIRSII